MEKRLAARITSGKKRSLTSTEMVKFKDITKSLSSFPLTLFENLRNVTLADALIFSGDGVKHHATSRVDKCLILRETKSTISAIMF